MEIYNVEEPKLGIILYRNAIPEDLNIPQRLESVLQSSSHELFSWKEALVGYNEKMPEYRDCWDLKMSPGHWQYLTPEFEEIKKAYEEVDAILKTCLQDYESRFNFKMEYMEAINFVKYKEGNHFSVHTDHGFSYTCTLSTVAYLNDDYDGGELWFPYMNIKLKPQKGDVIFFPSTYIFAHASLPVTNGTKYSAVTMFDYNDKNHKTDPSSSIPVNTKDGSTTLTKLSS